MPINVEKRMTPNTIAEDVADTTEVLLPEAEELDYELAEEEEQEDGSVVVDFDPDAEVATDGSAHDENLAINMDEKDLVSVATELVEDYKSDRLTRAEWEKAYVKGMTLMGLQIESRSQPWAGASGVFHPILTEAVIKFQAEAMTETFPAAGPVLTKVMGKDNRERTKQAKRVQTDMNYYCTEVMSEYRDEHEQALFFLPIAGSILKKVYFDHTLQRPASKFVMADDFVVAYGTTNIQSCPRATHVMKMSPNDLIKAQYAGEFRMVDVPKPVVDYTDVEKKEDQLSGTSQPAAHKDDQHTILEMHVDFDMPGHEDLDENGEETGIALPYRVTIDQSSQTILSIYRNWDEDDDLKTKLEFFIRYLYLPGTGFYGIGLTHLLGGIAKSATSILRQLVDAGTLANLPAGLKSRGLRIKGDDRPLRPGEFRDVDVPGGAIKDNITFLPYKEPSTVLFQLLGSIVEEGRNIASIADLKISDMNSQAPVGTTLAILERGMKVMSGVNARIHASMRREFKLLANLIRDTAPPEYEYEVEEGATRTKDYDERVDVLPISNPNASTMAHRIMTHQAIHQLAGTAPEIYDKKLLHRTMIEAMGADNVEKLIPMDEDMKPVDPVSENMSLMTGKPVKAFIHQDHESHIRVHLAAAEDPQIQKIIGQSPAAEAIAAAGAAHVQEHVAFQYRREIEKQLGVPLPEHDKDLPAETEVMLSKLIADAAEKLLKKDQAEAQAMKNAEEQNDPVLQLQKMDAETKQAEVQRKTLKDRFDLMLGKEKLAADKQKDGTAAGQKAQNDMFDKMIRLEELKYKNAQMASQAQQAGARLGVDVAQSIVDDQIERERIAAQSAQAEMREGVNLRRNDQMAENDEKRVENEEARNQQNLAQKFMGMFKSGSNSEQSGQDENK
jgi:chaperonin GroES